MIRRMKARILFDTKIRLLPNVGIQSSFSKDREAIANPRKRNKLKDYKVHCVFWALYSYFGNFGYTLDYH